MMTGVDVPCVLQVRYERLRVEHVPFLIWTLLGTSQQIGATSGDLRPGSSTFIMFFDLIHGYCWT